MDPVCRRCGERHKSLLRCEVARRMAALDMVANSNLVVHEVVHVVANEVSTVANRSGDRHRDKEARRMYMRDLMRKRRQRGSEEKGSG